MIRVIAPIIRSMTGEVKICRACGREMTWRKKWARNWEQVQYCSDACRGRKNHPIDRQLEEATLELLANRAANHTICPSEAARKVSPGDWRELMEPARRAARRLAEAGNIEVVQKGKRVDASTARGPIRLRLVRATE